MANTRPEEVSLPTSLEEKRLDPLFLAIAIGPLLLPCYRYCLLLSAIAIPRQFFKDVK
jgi:hypothetical protein